MKQPDAESTVEKRLCEVFLYKLDMNAAALPSNV
jgi:hypothetical protein